MFSFGNIIISTLTHKWPNPGPPKRYEGKQLIALTEFQRRDHYIVMFTPQEKQLFLPTVCQSLEDQPEQRPSSVMLVQELRCTESFLPTGSHAAAPIEQLRQQLLAKEEECRQKDKVIREKNKELRENHESLRAKDEVIREKDAALKEANETLAEKDATLREKDATVRTLQAENQQLRSQLDQAAKGTLLVGCFICISS